MRRRLSAEFLKSIVYSLPEGERREDMLLSVGTSDIMELSKLPDETPLGVRYDGVSFSRDVRTFVPLPSPDEAPVWKIIRTDLPASFFYDGALRSRRRFSFSGTQEKFTARLIVRNGEPTLENVDEANEVGNVIVKPWSGRYAFLPENEFFILSLMSKMGFCTAVPRLLATDDGRLHLVVERFDIASDAGAYRRLRVRQFAELMELSADENGKYSVTTEEILDFACAQIEEPWSFALAYAAGWSVGNGDMHAKNFSAVMDDDGCYRLAPLYDMLNTTVYKDVTGRLALPFGECCNPSPDGADLMEYFGERFGTDFLSELRRRLSLRMTTLAPLHRTVVSLGEERPNRVVFLERLAERTDTLMQSAQRDIDAALERMCERTWQEEPDMDIPTVR